MISCAHVQSAIHLLRCLWARLCDSGQLRVKRKADQAQALLGAEQRIKTAFSSSSSMRTTAPTTSTAEYRPGARRLPLALLTAVAEAVAPFSASRSVDTDNIVRTMTGDNPGALLVAHDSLFVPNKSYFFRVVSITLYLSGFHDLATPAIEDTPGDSSTGRRAVLANTVRHFAARHARVVGQPSRLYNGYLSDVLGDLNRAWAECREMAVTAAPGADVGAAADAAGIFNLTDGAILRTAHASRQAARRQLLAQLCTVWLIIACRLIADCT